MNLQSSSADPRLGSRSAQFQTEQTRKFICIVGMAVGFSILQSTPAPAQTTISTVTMVNNATQTPIEGVGHDYIHDLSEVVNPQNGQVSIRITGPNTHERGLNSTHYAYMYDTSGPYAMAGHLSFNSCSTQGSSVPVCYPRVDAPFWASVGSELPTSGSILGQDAIFANPSTTLSLNLGTDNGGVYTCTYTGPFIYEDPEGGLHNLNLAFINSGYSNNEDCSKFGGVSTTYLPAGRDSHYKAFLTNSNGGIAVSNLHGDILDSASFNTGFPTRNGYQTDEDSNGNLRNGSGRPWGYTTSAIQAWWGQYATVNSVTLPGVADPSSASPEPYAYHYSTVPVNEDTGLASYVLTPSSSSCYVGGTLNWDVTGLTGTFAQTVVDKLTLPNQQDYLFGYESNWGLINSITYPTGATVAYTWGINPQSEPFQVLEPAYDSVISQNNTLINCYFKGDLPAVQTRTVTYNGVPVQTQSFQYQTLWGANGTWTSKTTTVTTTDLIRTGHPSTVTIYNYTPFPTASLPWTAGQGYIPQESSIVYQDGQGNTLKTVVKEWASTDLLSAECEIIDSTHISGKFYTYQTVPSYGQVDLPTDISEYDFGQGVTSSCTKPSGTPSRETVMQYASLPSNYTLWPSNSLVTLGITQSAIPQINDRPSFVKVYDHGTLIAETDITYDQGTIQQVSPAAYGHDETNYGPNQVTGRGNPTTITRKCLTNCNDSITTVRYDETGQIVAVVAPNGNASGGTPANYTTSVTYSDNFTQGGSPASGVNTNTYVKTITRPSTNGIQHVSTFSYNYMLGELASATDENLKTTGYQYVDMWGRPTLATFPDGGQIEIQYDDDGPNPSVTKSVLQNTATNALITSAVIKDAVGNPVQTQLTEGSSSTVYTNTILDGNGRVYEQSNPTRCSSTAGSLPASCSEPTWGYATFTYDALGRTTLRTNSDQTTTEQWGYNGNVTTFTDENSNKWQRTFDAFGRLTTVMEPTAPNTTPTQETDYTYDALGDLLTASQKMQSGSRTRSFTYDSLARLVTAYNQETRTVCYGYYNSVGCVGGYDANGNVLYKTTPAPDELPANALTLRVQYSYDNLNRLLSKTYVNDLTTTPSSCYQYDSAISGVTDGNPKGRLTLQWTQPGSCPTTTQTGVPSNALTATVFSQHDTMGRVWNEQQCTLANIKSASCYSIPKTYDLAGDLTSYTNGLPSTPGAGTGPLTFNQTFWQPSGTQTAGYLQSVTSNWNSSNNSMSLFTAQGFAPHGALQNATLGSALSLTRTFDNRLRISGETDKGGPLSAATPGSATVTITGTEQSK